MKKITLSLSLTLLSIFGFSQVNETFESTTFPPAGWATFIGANGLGTVENWKQQVFDTGTAVCVWEVVSAGQTSEDWLVTPQVTVSASNPNLTFDSIDSSPTEYGAVYTVRVSTASQTTPSDFTIIDTQTEAQIFHSQTTMVGSNRTIDLTNYIGQSIYVAFVFEQNDGDLWRIDNVILDSDLSVGEFAASTISHKYNKNSKDLTLESSASPFDSVQIFSILGQNVLNKNLSQTNETINLSSLQDGIYLIKVSVEGRSETIKILKQ